MARTAIVAAAAMAAALLFSAVWIGTHSASAIEFGEASWSITVEPAEPRVGDTVSVSVYASGVCCSPLLGASLHVSQPDPRVFDIESEQLFGDWSFVALREGEAKFWVSGAFERWDCPDTPTPVVVVPPFCGPTLIYVTSPSFTVTVSGASTPIPHLGDVNCDGQRMSLDALLVLQYGAGLVGTLPCLELGDLDFDCVVGARDAALILQIAAALMPTPAPQPCQG